MQISLKQARRLEKDIEVAISALAGKIATPGRSESISIHENLHRKLETLHIETKKLYDSSVELTNARFAVRSLISTAKETSGLNRLITEEARLKELMSKANALASQTILTDEELSVASARLVQLKNDISTGLTKPTDMYGRQSDTVSVTGFLSQADIDGYTEIARSHKRAIADIADKCAALNSTTNISLDVDTVGVLQKYKLL
jgi:hypothetical protein